MKKSLGVLFLMPFLIWMGVRVVADIQYSRKCEGHLKRAADANNIPLAIAELQQAVDYAKVNGLTTGSTNILWETPAADIGFWYTNLTQALDELKDVPEGTSQLERTNILMKLRETLLDHGDGGKEGVTEPGGISIAPNNRLFALWGWLGGVLALAGILIAASDN